jgi:hypothetical protein
MSGFDEPYWNSLQVLSWVWIGDRSLTAQCSNHGSEKGGWYWSEEVIPDEFGAPKRELAKMPASVPSTLKLAIYASKLGEARNESAVDREILTELQKGALIATGKLGDDKRSEIDAVHWLDVCIDYDKNIATACRDKSLPYEDLRFNRDFVLGIWPDPLSNDVTGLRPALEQAASQQGDGTEKSPMSPDVIQTLAEWIFEQHPDRGAPKTKKALLEELSNLPTRPVSTIKSSDFTSAYRRVYQTGRGKPPHTGWPLNGPFKKLFSERTEE